MAKKTGKTYDETVAKLKKRYDGYRFAPEGASMYNPFSLLSTFMSNFYGYYWFKTGTPTFLTNTLQKSGFDIRTLDNDITIPVKKIDDYRAGETSLTPLLYQTGYLTIKSYDADIDSFTLGYPNEEVKYGFLDELLPAFIPKWGLDDSFSIITFIKTLRSGEVDDFMNLLRAYYAAIPYDLEDNRDKDASAEEALAQIDNQGYLIPYTADHRRLVKIGVEFSKEAKGIKRWLTSALSL